MTDGSATSTTRGTLPPLPAAVLVAAVSVAIYWSALGAGFVGDDFMILHRLRVLTGPADALRFFHGEFFEYYRPLGFVSHAVDWWIAGQNAWHFHLTNVLIHTLNAVVVLSIGRALSPRTPAGLIAALLFTLHPSNTEAVIWISARFDLLATCFGLSALCWMVRGWNGSTWVPALLFVPALLSKEAAVALPLAAAGWAVFVRGTSTRTSIVRVTPWLASLVVYGALRQIGGGVSPVGGSSRIPKLVALGLSLVVVIALSDGRWERVREWLKPRRLLFGLAVGALVAVATIAATVSHGYVGHLAREKLAVSGFALLYLTSPLLSPVEAVFSDPVAPVAWLAGALALVLACAVLLRMWERLLTDKRMWFLAAFLAAALLPISALTEGKRYLYLPSAATSLIAGILVGEVHSRFRRAAYSGVAIILLVSAVQITVKIRDWNWAGSMTADGARLVDAALAPSCGSGHVVFLTSPVAIHSVYSHFYYETFEIPRGCMPELFQVVARVVRVDTRVAVRWNGPGEIVMTVPAYRDNFILSEDLRSFTTPFHTGMRSDIETPLGVLHAATTADVAQLTLALTPQAQHEGIKFFYYSDGRIQPLASAR